MARLRLRSTSKLETSVSATCPAAYQAVAGSQTIPLAAGSISTVTWVGSSFQLTSGTSAWTADQPIVFQPTSGLLVLVNRSGILNAASAPYRGDLTVAHQSSGLCVINTLPVESYLRGVVPLEMSSSWPLEALKAQAVAARTYAVRSISSSGLFDLYSDTRSQAYGGAGREAATTNAAVTGTAGVIATYGGQPIAAFYFSTSGGHTENIENVWNTAPLPYLKGVDDPYDTLSPYHVWPDNPIRKSATSAVPAARRNGRGASLGDRRYCGSWDKDLDVRKLRGVVGETAELVGETEAETLADRDLLQLELGLLRPERSQGAVLLLLGCLAPIDFMLEGLAPILAVDLDIGLHGVALAFNPGLPAVELAGTFGALQVDLVAGNNGEPAILTLAVNGDMDLTLERVELEGLAGGDELELLRLGELRGKAKGCKVIEDCLLGDVRNDRGSRWLLPCRGREGRNVLPASCRPAAHGDCRQRLPAAEGAAVSCCFV